MQHLFFLYFATKIFDLFPDGKLLSVLRSVEPEKVYAMPDRSYPDDELKLKVTLSDLTDRELVAMIGWSKQVPGTVHTRILIIIMRSLLFYTWLY